MQLLKALERQYVKAALAGCEPVPEEVLRTYGEKALVNQKEMLMGYVDGDEQQYSDMMEYTFHKGSLEKNEETFRKESEWNYLKALAAEPVMEEEGLRVEHAEYENSVKMAAEALHMKEEHYRELCTFEIFKQETYARKLREKLFYHFAEKVQVTAEEE